MTTKKKAQVVLAGMFLIAGLLIIISAIGGSQHETIPFVKFMWSIVIGFCLMGGGLVLSYGVKR